MQPLEGTIPVQILGFSFELPTPYAVGHQLTRAEASALNKLLARTLGDGLHKVITRERTLRAGASSFLNEDQRAEIQSIGEEYVSEFVLGFAEGHDFSRAVKVEARRLAHSSLEARLNREGKTLDTLTEKEWRLQLAELAKSERIQTEARRRVQVTQEIAQRAHAELESALGGQNG